MIAVLKRNASQEDKNKVIEIIRGENFEVHPIQGVEKTVVGVLGDPARRSNLKEKLQTLGAVEKVVLISDPYKLTSWNFKQQKTVIDLGDGVKVGGPELTVMAGPCSVENRDQIIETAKIVKAGGAQILRGGAFKPRTSPYSFQGLGEEGLKLMAEAREETGLKIVTELMDVEHIDVVCKYTDIIQIGARNMQNYSLLKEIGKLDKPVMLKRGMAATIKEWLLAAEYVMNNGNHDVILCERGVRTFGEETRNTMDLSSIPLVQQLSHLPVIADPSHGTGRWELVTPVARAAVAVGADGIMVEVHPDPQNALSDGPQSLKPKNFQLMMDEINAISKSLHNFETKERKIAYA
ncbi:MAG: 3-deoxy-7-phosphoheptulonate synthase [Halanaerobium sp. 4-GBenrich]|jgi:3-deoxy-7-phosphoheptulonate synthase|uniref:3-deoxy-D-arabinoheptulosonate-7-phosphate synthase n=1 Tax=Halanaerobium congolense TaxID=54121 RepID=A0A1G6IZ23_9FIRM|nr:3-deoxy-7-phosphoheptulonate synthase [Halanaerobium congolense]KXS49826.1 MAG: 3-deoxy-7-phosphoheptulonate synthase [Halanaerobium sp. T82-1]ODS50461.1 MAG: 3-deoxy-7-phosphoheptulonate synthase [Halanaerobium sp. 4-GBenrich]PUU91716.1 MAG: 3-deoxy-7-phosphoheptulonate synthase [Halanaerobium sp.]PTX15848.1 3-deoxy-D-arabinoheptulosonate-7-phosphate synthase [Halanaerobium congolense]PXV70093.1 3-deoxy-D-arabinoheptulosonate-7-phosphate synthase [Halanaerobium congolense]